jgi:hypothetical protein
VQSAYTLAEMRADRRFDRVVAAEPMHFDVEAAASGALQRFQDLADNAEASLEVEIDVI